MNKRPATYVQTLTQEDLLRQVQAAQSTTTLALLFHTHSNQLQAVTAHQVGTRGKGLQIMPGRPLSPEDELNILNLLQRPEGQAEEANFLPENVLIQDRFSTLWWVPSSVRPMYLHPVDGKRKTVQVRWPTMVFYAINRKLYLAGLQSDERPTPSTKVFHTPLPNIWASTQLCTGSAKLPTDSNVASIPDWEEIVFATGFSHQNHTAAIHKPKTRTGIDPMTYWSKADKKTTPFPATHLTSLNMTLGKWLAAVRADA